MATTPTTTDSRGMATGANRTATTRRFAQTLRVALALTAGLLGGHAVHADATASHRVTVRVEPVSALALEGGDIELAVPRPQDGAPSSASDASCRLDWLTNQASHKITVASSLPSSRLPLSVEAVSAEGGSPVGSVTLTAAAQDLVVSLARGAGHCRLRYTAQASGLEQPTPEVHLITYTLTDLR